MRYRGVIFDFNGVLLWDTLWHDEAWKNVSGDLRGIPFSEEEMQNNVHGKANKDVFSYVLGKDIDGDELHSHIKMKETAYQGIALSKADDFRLSPGAENLFELLKENRIPFTIGTSSPEINVRFYVHNLHLDKWFNVEKIAFDDGTVPGKPAPDIFLRAAEKISVPIEKCVVIEDSRSGIKAAQNAGAGKIIGLGPREKHTDLMSIGAHKTIESLAEMSLADLE